ncbi:MAG: DNA polymerase III subunit beta [Anaerovibrio sp.]|uniref:DNA polymerase III subunit beta n=1 Tax=Anaerovibrio sp. TaxID=1872532 RepID=UPI0026012D3B|nr:DNA polymerase III subunit beta [Anaerovibrio sp.]MCR5176073.1 DNA polymerase III subunit beta [Anaerovibrio sp.]
MKFICKRTDLVQSIQTVSKAVSSKNQNPILSGIYIKAENNTLELQATDYEIGIICKVEAQVEEPGNIVLSGKYIQEVIRKLPGVNVEFEYDKQEKISHIKSNRSHFTLLSMSADDFPIIHKIAGDYEFKIMDNILRELISRTTFSCSNEEARPVFTGCLMEINESSVIMAATDTKRLAVQSKIVEGIDTQRKMIIPSKILNEIQKLLISDMPRTVNINYSTSQISFEFDNTYISSRLIDGQYPDYHRVIPNDFSTRIKLNTEEFRAVVDRIALISRTNDYNIATMEFANGMVRITSNNPEIGNADESLAAEIDGEDITISFNADYISDVLKIIESKEFYISLNNSLSPAAIRMMDDESFTYVITPVRTMDKQ